MKELIQIVRSLKFQAVVACLVVVVAGCGSPPLKLQPKPPAAPIDFTGSWEIDYRMSDRVEENVDLLRLIAIAEARRAQDRMDRRIPVLPSFELVKLADSISQAAILEIKQDKRQIEIKRGEEFPFSCTFNAVTPQVDEFGTEICGWDGHQLVFAFFLPERLNISHRLTLAPEGDKLNVATTVRRRGSAQAFTLNRVYSRFEPLPEQYECRDTVEGTKSCRRVDRPANGEFPDTPTP